MATITGFDGNITWLTDQALGATNWVLVVNQMEYNLDILGTAWREVSGGVKSWSGSVSGRLLYNQANSSPGLAALPGTPGSVTFTAASGCTYTGTVLITGAQITVDKYDATNVNISFNFTGSGALSESAWDETP